MRTLLEIANEGYPGGLIASYFDLKTGKELKNPAGGDTLALFVGRELVESVGLKPTRDNIGMAIGILETAVQDIQDTIAALGAGGGI